MNSITLLIPVFGPILAGILIFVLPRRLRGWKEMAALLAGQAELFSAILLLGHTGEIPHWAFSHPSLEIHFNFSAPEALRTSLVIATAFETFFILLLLFLLLKKSRADEYLFFFLYASGILNGIILSQEYVGIIVFGEILFVTLCGAVVLIGLISSYFTRDGSRGQVKFKNLRLVPPRYYQGSEGLCQAGLRLRRPRN